VRPRIALREYLLARLDTLAGRLPAARERALTAWQLAPDGPVTDTELRARIAAELARTNLTTGHGAAAADWAQRALALVPAGSDAAQDSPGTLLLAAALQGRPEEALVPLAGLPRVISDPTAGDLDGMIARGLLSLWSGDVEQAILDLAPVVRLTRRDGPAHLTLGAGAYLSEAQYRAGDWDTAISEAEIGIALALDLDHVRTLPLLHAVAAAPLANRGEFAAAAAHVERALATADQVGDMQTMLWARTAAARLGRASGDAAAVHAAVEPLARAGDLDGVNEPGIAAWRCHYAWALAELGRPVDAAAVLDGAAQRATDRRLPVEQLAASAGRADLALRGGDIDLAVRLVADAAREHYRAVTWHPFERATFDLTHGITARRAGERREAADALRRALQVFTRLRARPWLAQAESELDRCGVTRRPRRSSGARSPRAELTATETVVTRLVASGLSNREIAAHLVVSVKTVEYHVSNALAKAGVTSRTQLATWHLNRPGESRPDEPFRG
jgi:DNA-binding CsgD family transcriptional regulator/tetratricopeptide (TPR) repeat protein